MAVVVHDPDAPLVDGFTHGSPTGSTARDGVRGGRRRRHPGVNSIGRAGYTGPAPPPGHGCHHYFFWVYALREDPGLEPGLERREVLDGIEDLVIEQARLVGDALERMTPLLELESYRGALAGHHAEIARRPPARALRRRPRPRRAPGAEASGSTSTTPKNRVTDETIAPAGRARRGVGLARAARGDVPRRAHQRHRGPRRAPRRAADAARALARSSTASTSCRRCTRCSTGWAPSPTGPLRRVEGAHRQADPQRRQHRHRRLRPRAR